MAKDFSSRLQRSWYTNSPWTLLLLPLAWIFQLVSFIRRNYILSVLKPNKPQVPVVVVGNISVGGTGKTPLIIALANHLVNNGLKVGVISRGYGSQASNFPLLVQSDTDVKKSGDEALLIAKATNCPVVISPARLEALEHLLQQHQCDIVLSDDGLQHYKLGRDFEIAVIDGRRGMGNGLLLPAGPLREKPSRLNNVDCVVINGELNSELLINKPAYNMSLKANSWRKVIDDSEGDLSTLSAFDQVHAVAGIGNPERFFRSLREMNIDVIQHGFPDHHVFTLEDITFADDLPVVMTAKDAVKCQGLLSSVSETPERCQDYWYVPVNAILPVDFYHQLIKSLSLPNASTNTELRTQA